MPQPPRLKPVRPAGRSKSCAGATSGGRFELRGRRDRPGQRPRRDARARPARPGGRLAAADGRAGRPRSRRRGRTRHPRPGLAGRDVRESPAAARRPGPALQPGDEIQLGGVQLQVPARRDRPVPPDLNKHLPARRFHPRPHQRPRSSRDSFPFPSRSPGGICRTWDDFLTLAAQRWSHVRDELTSGRITEHLKRVRASDLVPRPEPGQSPDERLDNWLARLPNDPVERQTWTFTPRR